MNTVIRYSAFGLIIFSLALFCALQFWPLVIVAGTITVYCLYVSALDSWASDIYRELFYKQLKSNEELIDEMLDILPKA